MNPMTSHTSEKNNLEVFRLSAKALGWEMAINKEGRPILLSQGDAAEYWNPFTNAEQRWACVEKLLEMGKFTELDTTGGIFLLDSYTATPLPIYCPASEFPARALAELWRRSQ